MMKANDASPTSDSTNQPESVDELREILDSLATQVHNLSPGDIGSMDRVLVPIEGAHILITKLINTARIEAVAEFAERVKGQLVDYGFAYDGKLAEVIDAAALSQRKVGDKFIGPDGNEYKVALVEDVPPEALSNKEGVE